MSSVPSQIILGVIGVIRLNAGLHLLVITKAERVGQIRGKDVFKITEAKVEKLGSDKGLSAAEVLFCAGFFYFSPSSRSLLNC